MSAYVKNHPRQKSYLVYRDKNWLMVGLPEPQRCIAPILVLCPDFPGSAARKLGSVDLDAQRLLWIEIQRQQGSVVLTRDKRLASVPEYVQASMRTHARITTQLRDMPLVYITTTMFVGILSRCRLFFDV